MKDSRGYTLLFSAILGTACSLLLTAGGDLTASRRKANAKAEEVRNVLGVLGADVPANAAAADLVGIFEEKVRKDRVGGVDIFRYGGSSTAPAAVAVPFAGPGLWGPVKGFLALEDDMNTIRAITFHEQEETPGLGGEIGSDWFRDQFRGKKIRSSTGSAGIRILRGTGGAKSDSEVDGITGATLTCRKVQAMLNDAIQRLAKGKESG